MFDGKLQILNNGIKLVTIKKDTNMASINIGVRVGSLYEKKCEKGISHFLEHMLFKGTKSKNNEELNIELEELGGDYNAYTDNSCTVYTVTSLKDELQKGIEILSDMLQNSIFDEVELEKERGVILSEIRTSKDDIEDLSFKMINQVGFIKSPLKYDTIGEEETVRSFKRDTLMNFYEKYYVPNNTYISIVSPYSHEAVEKMVKENFSEWIWKEFKVPNIIEEKNKEVRKISYKNDIEQSTIVYLYTFYDLTKEEEMALKVLNHKFGESANSILFRELRENRGLAYDVYTHLDTTKHVKTLYIYTAVAEENIEEASNVIEDCINKIINREIVFNENTINLMKKVLKTAVVSTLEDSTELSNYVVHQLMDDEDIYGFNEDMEILKDIKEEEIYTVGKKVFKNPTIHILKSLT